MTQSSWQPGTDRSRLEARALLLRQIREFFFARQVLEVETPLLGSAAGTDPALAPITAAPSCAGYRPRYLQTSPEFAMKRLLAAGSGPIYQVSKAFRDDEQGARHNPEFTLLEWYRPDFTLARLMDEVQALVSATAGLGEDFRRVTYSALFQHHLAVEPHTAPMEQLRSLAEEKIEVQLPEDTPRDHWLDLLFSHCIEPTLQEAVFVTHWPASQAALAQIVEEAGHSVALRFELIAAGMELANGYQELTDPIEQRRRFEQDLLVRKQRGLPELPIDEHLLEALGHGLPACAGVALGVDRLLMLKTGSRAIDEVLAFPFDRI